MGRLLRPTAECVARYLVDHVETLSLNTLRQRLAALAQWHLNQGFADPTKAPIMASANRSDVQMLMEYVGWKNCIRRCAMSTVPIHL
jgi:hypothetical protein